MAVLMENDFAAARTALAAAVADFLTDSGSRLQADIRTLSRVDTGQTRQSYTFRVKLVPGAGSMEIGSPLENALYEEYGTGEYALGGDGRKGGWVYRDGEGNFHHTRGKTPNRPMEQAYRQEASALVPLLEEKLKRM